MWAAIPGDAASPDVIARQPLPTGGAPARNVTAPGDLVSVYNFGPLQQAVAERGRSARRSRRAVGACTAAASASACSRRRARRRAVHAAPGPAGYWFFPMSVTALPLDSIGAAMGRDVSSIISAGMVVMGQTSATLTGAQAGDVVELLAAERLDRAVHRRQGRARRRGRRHRDRHVHGAGRLARRNAVDERPDLRPVRSRPPRQRARVAGPQQRSEDPRTQIVGRRSTPTRTIGLAKTKKFLGEFAYHVRCQRQRPGRRRLACRRTSRRTARPTRRASSRPATT